MTAVNDTGKVVKCNNQPVLDLFKRHVFVEFLKHGQITLITTNETKLPINVDHRQAAAKRLRQQRKCSKKWQRRVAFIF